MRIGLSLAATEPRYNLLAQNIQALFADGSQGWWYDDNDTTTLFQDSAGTTPVTAVEQFVGLQLDKSKGLVLGPELVAPIDFTSGWSSSGAAVTFNSATSYTAAGVANVFRSFFTVGVWYKLEIRATFTGGFTLFNGTSAINQLGSALVSGQTQTVYFSALAAQLNIRATSAGTITINSISVRELPGNHRYAPASGNRPIWSKRVNLLTKTEQFDDAVWVGANRTIIANTTTAPDGTQTADTLTGTGAGAMTLRQDTATTSATVTVSFFVKSDTATTCTIGDVNIGSLGVFNLSTGSVVSGAAASIASFGNGWYRCAVTYSPVAGFARFTINPGSTYLPTTTTSIYIWGADLRPANQATGLLPLYQRVNTSSDYDTNGFPGYLKADGVDDFLQTNSIDFSAGPTNPPLGPELVVNGDGTTLTGWTSVNDASCTTAVSGGQFVLTTVAGGGARLRQTIPVTAGRAYRITGFVQANNNSAAGALQVWGTGYGSGDLYASAQVVNGTVSATVTATSANLYLQLNAFNSSSGITNYYDNISVKEITNANLGADKITLCAGVRKLSDAARAVVTELGSGLGVGFSLFAPNITTVTFAFRSFGGSGGATAETTATFAAPTTRVLTGVGEISTDTSILRVNGVQEATSATDQGAGNYPNQQAFFFRRTGLSSTFTGYEYGNIAVGKLLTADQLRALETYMNGLTKAY